jgi:hypothetical protein
MCSSTDDYITRQGEPIMHASITQQVLTASVLRALREWLFELGHKSATIGSPRSGLGNVYHLLDVGRLVQVRAAIAPSHPESLSARELRELRALARRCGASPWEARIIVRRNLHPAAILWRKVEAPA